MEELYNKYYALFEKGMAAFDAGNIEASHKLFKDALGLLDELIKNEPDKNINSTFVKLKQELQSFIDNFIYNEQTSNEHQTIEGENNDSLSNISGDIETDYKNHIERYLTEAGNVEDVDSKMDLFLTAIENSSALSDKTSNLDVKRSYKEIADHIDKWANKYFEIVNTSEYNAAYDRLLKELLYNYVLTCMQKKLFDDAIYSYKQNDEDKAKELLINSYKYAGMVADSDNVYQTKKEEYKEIMKRIDEFMLNKFGISAKSGKK